jgi:hypothetical protein
MDNQDLDVKKVMKKWYSKKSSTKGRKDKNGMPIEFKLSFEDYYKLYNDYGKYPSLAYVLCRKDDLGHYEAGNVYVDYFMNNLTAGEGNRTELDKKINNYCEQTGYKRRIVKAMLKRKELVL